MMMMFTRIAHIPFILLKGKSDERTRAREREIEKIKYCRAAVVCHDSVCGAVENLCDWQEKLSRECSARE